MKDEGGCDICRCDWDMEEEMLTMTELKGEPMEGPVAEGRESVCELPWIEGTCNAERERWYYNPKSQQCEKFTYSGCRGNANNFRTKIRCINYCIRGVDEHHNGNGNGHNKLNGH